MEIEIRRSFLNDVKKIKENKVKEDIKEFIIKIKSVKNLQEITNLKKLSGYKNYYRVKIKNYRVGLFFDNNKLSIVRCLHRKEIYKFFP